MSESWPIKTFIADELGEHPFAHFATPAHGRLSRLSKSWEKFRVPGIELLDLPYIPKEIWRSSELIAADKYGTSATYYFPTGASYAVLAGVHSTFSQTDIVAVARNIHVSVLSALTLVGAKIHWLCPETAWFIYTPDLIAEYLDSHLEVSGLILTNPSYEGHYSDIPRIALLCRERAVKLIIDESLGAHWVGMTDLPCSAIHTKADIVLHSLHKRVGALVPAALLHLPRGSRIEKGLLDQYVTMFRSTSPSNAVLLSTELAIENHFNFADDVSIKGLTSACEALTVRLASLQEPIAREVPIEMKAPLVFHFLPRKSNPLAIAETVYELGMNYEHVDGRGIVFFVSTREEPSTISRLGEALAEASGKSAPGPSHWFCYHRPTVALPPTEALLANSERRPLGSATIGKISSELTAECPPGIPVLIPGEYIQEWHVQRLGCRNVRIVKDQR